VTENNDKKGLKTVQRRPHSVLQLQLDCYESVARIRLVKTEDNSMCKSEL
jgi:hypothetical protein